MAIGTTYFASNEITGFTTFGAVAATTNASLFRPLWSRCAIQVSPAAAADPPTNRMASPLFTPNSSMWVHAQIAWSALGGSADNNSVLFRLLDASGVARLMVRGAGSGAVKISKRDAAGVFTDLVTSPANSLPVAGLAPFPMDFQVTYGVSGTCSIWFGDVMVASFAGDNTTDAATQLAQVDFANTDISNGIFWSEELVSSVITINAGVFTLPPLASGATQQWAGVVADIDKVLIDDTTFISDGTPGDLSGWTTPIALPTGAWAIQSIVQEVRAAVGVVGPQHFDYYLRTADGSDHLGGASIAPALTFGNFPNFIWATNPHTVAPWQVADLAAGFNLGVESLT